MSDNPPAPDRGDSPEPPGAAPTPETATPERPAEYLAEVGFEELALSPEIRRALVDRGYTHPTPVQAQAFDPVMQGKDLIVRSKTGTGKTAAFGLPLLEKMDPEDKAVRALVLCPTRELALQVAAELSDLGKHKGVRVSAIYGGASMKEQEDALESGSPIVVGTPGRIWDHIRRKNLKLQGCRHVVLDEADEMLNQGFYEEVTRILDQLPKDRQVLLFSATVPPEIQNLISQYTTSPEMLMLSGDVLTVDHIHHIRYDVTDAYPKPRNLIYLLEMEEPDNAIVFCNTRDDTALVTAVLNRNGFDAELLNGDLPQKERERVMGKVKRGEVAFMVATDIAARGIDISDLQYVINYSLPEDPAVYLHRVGRTGRIGKKGTAINLVSGRELGTFSALEKKYGIKFEKREMPSPEDAMRMWTERHVREIQSAAAGSVYEGYLGLAGALKQRADADDAIAFLLKFFFGHLRMEKAQAAAAEQAHTHPPRDRERSRGDRPRRSERSEQGERSDRGERHERGDRHERGERAGHEERSGGRERRERRERAPRRDRPEESAPAAAEPSAPGQVRLWLNLGSSEGLDAAGITAALEGLGAPAGKLIRLDVRPTYSYGFVAEEDAAAFEKLNGQQRGEKTLRLERARRR
ncbi:MAG TPA: DEAD/DEAH box helicase [Myxococcaceae bacterium]|nr:DEAD/DEAH box helicase [Myxococcaceae bacterium]